MAGGITDYNQIFMNKSTHFFKIFLGFWFFVVEVYHVAPSVISFSCRLFSISELAYQFNWIMFSDYNPSILFSSCRAFRSEISHQWRPQSIGHYSRKHPSFCFDQTCANLFDYILSDQRVVHMLVYCNEIFTLSVVSKKCLEVQSEDKYKNITNNVNPYLLELSYDYSFVTWLENYDWIAAQIKKIDKACSESIRMK